jgi:hypothetical protein
MNYIFIKHLSVQVEVSAGFSLNNFRLKICDVVGQVIIYLQTHTQIN